MKEEYQSPASLGITLVVLVLIVSMGSAGDESVAKKYSKNQATTQASNCGNGESGDGSNIPARGKVLGSVSCQNINSQIQGNDNSVALAGVHDGIS
jgi:hypothetical protein